MIMAIAQLVAPFQYFGGKRKVVRDVWARFGDVRRYIEPFFGSGAVLLGAPWDDNSNRYEVVNDADAFVVNFWRAVRAQPDHVAELMDSPVNECDLESRHKWLVEASRKANLEQSVKNDPAFFNTLIAAWWCWGICLWIGSGWCAGEWHAPDDSTPERREPHGSFKHLPHISGGMGVHASGLRRRKSDTAEVVQDVCGGGVISSQAWLRHRSNVLLWMRELSCRLRFVNVACGDWTRVVSPAATLFGGTCAIFLDPPYADTADRASSIYRVDSLMVAHRVREWAIEHGQNPLLRICLCGYEGEHQMPDDWECFAWKAQGGYSNRSGDNDNRHRERLWFSPHCLKPAKEATLFDDHGGNA